MTQPTIKVLQISQEELASFVSTELAGTTLDGLNNVVLSTLTEGEVLSYSGSPLEWRNVPSSAPSIKGGDGITSSVGSPTSTTLIVVDSTVARRDAINTFQQANTFTATVSGINSAGVFLQSAVPGYILDDTGAGADESIWRVFSSGGQLVYDVRNDANDTSANWLTVDRTGITVTAINFVADSLTFNGVPIHTGSPIDSGGGGGGGSPVTADLGGLTDVVLGSPLTSNLLFHNGTNWVDTAGKLTWDGSQLILPFGGSPVTISPELAFGDGDTGFYEPFANTIRVAIAGAEQFQFTGNIFMGTTGNAPRIMNEAPSDTNPTLLPGHGDATTGIGSATGGTVNIIANSVNCMSFDETSGTVTNKSLGKINVPDGSAGAPTYSFTSNGTTGMYAVTSDTLLFSAGGIEAVRYTEVSNDVLQAVSSNVGLTAAVVVGSPSSAQGEGIITSSHNVYSAVANVADAATLPTTFVVGTKVYVKNDGANSMDVFPASGDTITPNAVNIAEAVPAGSSVTFIGTVASTTWTKLIDDGAQQILDIQTSVGGSPALGSPLGAYTLVLGDELDKWIRLTASSIIVPPNATTAFAIGSQVTIFNLSGAATTIAAGGSPIGTVTVNGVSSVADAAGVALVKVATDEWDAV